MIIEKEDTFEIETRNLVVGAYRPDSFSWHLDLESPDATWTLTIEGSYSLKDDRGAETTQIDDLVGKSVLSVRARKNDGQLDVAFDRDWVLTVHPGTQYEPWQMYSTHGERLISVPGDGIAMWSATT